MDIPNNRRCPARTGLKGRFHSAIIEFMPASLHDRPSAPEAALWLLALLNFSCAVANPFVLNSAPGFALRAGLACLVSGLFFLLASARKGPGFWDPLRCELASLACGLWGFYLVLFSRGLTYWLLDIIFSIIALFLWLGRGRPAFLVASGGIFAVIGIRHFRKDLVIAALDLVLLWWALRHGLPLAAKFTARAAARPKKISLAKAGAAAALFALLAVFVGRPLLLMVNPPARHKLLLEMQPSFPVTPPERLSPLAARLRTHVVELAGKIGERSAYQPDEQDKARDYVAAEFRKAGYEVTLLEYAAQRKSASGRTRPYYNIEARLLPKEPSRGGAWILSAHYDTAPGTPGADDNTSAVAILLETAKLLRRESPAREIRFVAFSTEEPPSFTTRDMGSYRYLRYLQDGRVKIYGLLNLEMLGYFNPKPGSQLFPPFMNLFHPDTGNFVSLTSNLSSYRLMRAVERTWRRASKLPLETAFLPSVPSALFLSDHLNFWFSGERALMLGDTAYFRNPHYHQDSDTPEKLDYETMAEITRAVTAVVKEL